MGKTVNDQSRRGASVAAIIQHRVGAGNRVRYEEWLAETTQVARRFHGHVATSVGRPDDAGDGTYSIVLQFVNGAALEGWLHSRARAHRIDAASALIEDENLRRGSALEDLVLPPVPGGPPRWKSALLTCIAVFLVNVVVHLTIAPALDRLYWVLRLAVGAAIVVGCLAWVLLPILTKLFDGWLHRGT